MKMTLEKLENFKKLSATQTVEGFELEVKKWRQVCIDVLNELFQNELSRNPQLTMSDFMTNAASENALLLLKFDFENENFADDSN